MSRADKLRALSRDPGATEAERAAATAALKRHEKAIPRPPPPEKHSREWFAQTALFQRRVSELHMKIASLMPLGRPPLTWEEYKVLKNLDRGGISPFGPDVAFIEMCERKLSERASRPDDAQKDEAIALAYKPGITVDS